MDFILDESLSRPIVKRWSKRIKERFFPEERETIILSCSSKKPYSLSNSHRKVKRGLGKKFSRVNKITLTSPLGLVPEELETIFPANCYDTSVSGYWNKEEIENSRSLLKDYLGKLGKQKVFAYVDEAYKPIFEGLDIPILNSIKELDKVIIGDGKPKSLKETISKASRFQFGVDLTEAKLREVRGRIIEQGKYLFTIDDRRGKLMLTSLSASRLLKAKKNRVFVDFRLRSENLFSPGIKKADKEILAGDEVIVINNSKIRGFGEALISGKLMGSYEGLGVKLRKLI